MAPQNQAAWIPAESLIPLQVDDASYTQAGPGQMVIKNGAIGINPFDWLVQEQSGVFAPHLRYPMVIGFDVAGTVVEIGPRVTRFKVGDRVAGCAVSVDKESNRPSEGAFQLYTVVRERMVVRIPGHMTDEKAAVLGLGLTTAAFGLFHQDYLDLDKPKVPPPQNPRLGA